MLAGSVSAIGLEKAAICESRSVSMSLNKFSRHGAVGLAGRVARCTNPNSFSLSVRYHGAEWEISKGNRIQVKLNASNHNDMRCKSSVEYEQVTVKSVVQETVVLEERVEAVSSTSSSGPPAFVTATGRVISIGDIHGDIQKALSCLKIGGVIDERDGRITWVGADTTVVQLGDVLDRGDAEISTILLLRELDKQARHHGGAVYMLNGNHESLNVAGDFRYVTPGAFLESAMAAGLTDKKDLANKEAVLKARWSLYKPGGVMAKELSRNPTVLVVNKELVFAHGGLLPHHVAYGVQRINDEVAAWMKGADCSDGSAPSPPFTAMGDSNSVMWNRTFGKERCSPYDRIHMKMQLDSTLQQLGAKAMIVGHTPQMSGLNAECNGRIWRVDVGMSSGVLNAEPQVLEFSKDKNGNLTAALLTAQFTPYSGETEGNGI